MGDASPSEAQSSPRDEPECTICSAAIQQDEVYMSAVCTTCGNADYHVDCITPFLHKVHHDSTRGMERARRLIIKKPDYYAMQVRLECPRPGPTACGGRLSHAEMVKPVKAPPPPPLGLELPAGGGKKNKGKGAAAAPQPQQQQAPGSGRQSRAGRAPPPPPPPTLKQQQQAARVAAAAIRANIAPSYSGYESPASVASGGSRASGSATARRDGGPRGGGGPRGESGPGQLRFPPGKRPLELQLCADYEDMGACYLHRCPRCHGEEELREREALYLARQQAERRKQRQAELERHRQQAAARAEQAVWLEQVAARELERVEHEEGYLQMGEATLRLMKDHKRARCFERLLDMGFDPDLAGPATEAAGADAPAAAGLLTEGTLGEAAPKPIDVTTEAQELLACAASLGFGLEEVEMALLLSNGDWDGASAQLAAQAEQATMAASVADSGRAAGPAVGVVGPALTAAGSDDPELAAALAASTSAAALAYNISRQAAAAAAAAREEADLAAAIRASEEEARRQQAAHALPWAQQSSAAGTTYGGRLVQAEWGAQQTAQQQQPHGWYAPADKDGMPEFAGGWDAGPAAVAAASGRTSAASALPPAPDPWQQPPAPLSAGLPGSSLGRISALSVQDSATAAAPAGPWASIPAVHDYGALPAITSGIGGLAAAAAGSGLASLQPKSADLAAAVAAAQPEAQGVATVTANWDAPKALAGGFAPATPALQQQPPPASEEELDSLMALLGVS